MNILLWTLQLVISFFCVAGSIWRYFNYEQVAKDVPSMGALSYGVWTGIGVFEIICALLLILPGLINMKPGLTAVAAVLLTIELILISALHLKYFGLQVQASNPAMWSIALCALAAFIAYGRIVLRPL